MQLGSFTAPPLALGAVVGAGVLVILVLWGVRRARRSTAPDPLPVAPPSATGGPQPCAEDWTGEAAGGPADPVPPRPRTVADVVAARETDPGSHPAHLVPVPAPAPAVGRHTAPHTALRTEDLAAPADERPDDATLARTEPPSSRRRQRAEESRDTTDPGAASAQRTDAPVPHDDGTGTARTTCATGPEPGPDAPGPAPGDSGTRTAGTGRAGSAATRAGAGAAAAGAAAAAGIAAAGLAGAGSRGAGAAGAADADARGAGATSAGSAGAGSRGAGAADAADVDARVAGATSADSADAGHRSAGVAGAAAADARGAGATNAGAAAADARGAGTTGAGSTGAGPGDGAAAGAVAADGTDAGAPNADLAGARATGADAMGAGSTGGHVSGAEATGVDPATAGSAGADAPHTEPGRANAAGVDAAGADAEPPEQAGSARPGRAATPGSADDATRPLPPWSVERTVPAHEDLPRDAERGDVASAATPPDGVPTTGPAWVTGREPVSRAVQQALAARAVQRARMYRGSEGGDPATGDQQELPLTVVPSRSTAPVTDVRDRLLGVLLADPARAVDAARRLDDSRDRIEQLGDALRRRREDLAGAVRHLHECGLDPVQIGRLSGIPTADVRTILDGEDAGRG